MNFGEAISTGFIKYFNFSDRARRSEYWYWALFGVIVAIVGNVGNAMLHTHWVNLLLALPLIIPGWAVAVRRLHDVDRTGWWLLIAVIPLIGAIVLYIWFANQGHRGPEPVRIRSVGRNAIAGSAIRRSGLEQGAFCGVTTACSHCVLAQLDVQRRFRPSLPAARSRASPERGEGHLSCLLAKLSDLTVLPSERSATSRAVDAVLPQLGGVVAGSQHARLAISHLDATFLEPVVGLPAPHQQNSRLMYCANGAEVVPAAQTAATTAANFMVAPLP